MPTPSLRMTPSLGSISRLIRRSMPQLHDLLENSTTPGNTSPCRKIELVVLFGGARLLTSRRRFALARRVRLARITAGRDRLFAPPKVSKCTTTKIDGRLTRPGARLNFEQDNE